MILTPAQNSEAELPKTEHVPRLPKSYVAFWGVAACVSLTYLAISIAQPNLLGRAPMSADNAPQASSPQASQQSDANDAFLDEQLRQAKERARLSREAEQKAAAQRANAPSPATQATAQVDNSDSSRLTVPGIIATAPDTPVQPATNLNAAPSTSSAGPTPDPAATSAQPQAEPQLETKTAAPAELAANQQAAIKVPPLPTRAPSPPVNVTRVIDDAKQAATTITQRTTKVVPINYNDNKNTRPNPLIGVRLGTGPSVEALRLTWSFLLQHHQPVLQGLEPRYFLSPVQDDSFGPTYALVAGPMGSEAQARSVCNSLATRGMKCDISLFGGSAL